MKNLNPYEMVNSGINTKPRRDRGGGLPLMSTVPSIHVEAHGTFYKHKQSAGTIISYSCFSSILM